MQRRHPNRSREMRGPADWQERNERAYWGSDENDLPHYDDMLLPDDERETDPHDAREPRAAERIDERRWRDEPPAGGGARAYGAAPGHAPGHAAPRWAHGSEPYDAGGARRRSEPYYPHQRSQGGHGAPSRTRYDPPGHPAREAARTARTAPRLRGPKGYTRSDERIREDVCERLAYAIDIDVSEVSVTVKDACVQLEGTVPERWMKHEIEDLADSCVWVRDVDNRVRVARAASGDAPYPVPRAEAQPTLPPPLPSSAAAHPCGALGPGEAEPPAGPAGPAADPPRH
ncbi:BON domain-containing protein [Burkholderia glumae]|uniref:BON domain-containing protein n=1 Tax=Burkholderia glumae TaxID=337 RepID=UPI001463A2ED|nr:BON domain-containing protein [Burkholderia glumae]QJP71249.1 BON domain-containing protein [Burkholderia glumae]